MRRRTCTLALLLLLLLPSGRLHADPAGLQQLQQQQAGYSGQLQAIEAEHRQVLAELFALNRRMQELRQQIDGLTAKISEAEAALAGLQQEAERLQAQYRAVLRQFGIRVRFLYEDGRLAFLAALLESASFSDFLLRLEFVQLALRHDAALMARVRELRGQVAAHQARVEAERAALVSLRTDLLGRQQELAEAIAGREARLASLKEQRGRVEGALASLEALWDEQARPVLAAFGEAYQTLVLNLADLKPDALSLTGVPPGARVMLTSATLTGFFNTLPAFRALTVQVRPGQVNLLGSFSGVPLEISGVFEIAGDALLRYRPLAVRFFGVAIPAATVQQLTGSGRLDVDLSRLAAPARVKLQEVRMEEGRLFVQAALGS